VCWYLLSLLTHLFLLLFSSSCSCGCCWWCDVQLLWVRCWVHVTVALWVVRCGVSSCSTNLLAISSRSSSGSATSGSTESPSLCMNLHPTHLFFPSFFWQDDKFPSSGNYIRTERLFLMHLQSIFSPLQREISIESQRLFLFFFFFGFIHPIFQDCATGLYHSYYLNATSTLPEELMKDLAMQTVQTNSSHRIQKVD